MKTIYKYPINDDPIIIPNDSKIRHVGLDPQGVVCVWVELNTNSECKNMNLQFKITGTGQRMSEDWENYASSILQGAFMWHIYYRKIV